MYDEITMRGVLDVEDVGISGTFTTMYENYYVKPIGGIPSSDMTEAVQQSLALADTAYQKPEGGIPASDIAAGVIPDVSDVVRYSSQSLTDQQKTQARSNIGAGDVEYFDVTYGLTFQEEIRAAYRSGQTLRLLVDGMVVPMVYYQDMRASYYPRVLFEAAVNDKIYRYSYNYSGSGWSSTVITPYEKPATGIPAGDLAAGVIPDVSNFITASVNNLVNYYLKSETYTKTEFDNLISAIQGFSYEVVSSLPTASADTMGKIYLVPSATSATNNVKDEYITIDNGASADTRYTWEQIGSTSVDLSGYVTTSDLNTALADYTTTANLTTLLAGKADAATTLAGYGITDAKIESGVITLGSNTITPLTSHQDISGKADKVSGATSGNFAGLDGNGNLTDSGKKASDFLTSHQSVTDNNPSLAWSTKSKVATIGTTDIHVTMPAKPSYDYSEINNTPTIPTVTAMSAAAISTAIDTAWNAVMS